MLAITSDSFSGYGLDHAFALTAAAGLDGIEVIIEHGRYDTQDAEYLKMLSKRHKLPIVALSAPINMSPEKVGRIVNLAAEVGAPLITLLSPDIFDFNYKKWIREEAQTFYKKKKVIVALVNPPVRMVLGILPKYAFNDIYQLKDFDNLVFDTSNAASKTEPLLEIYSVLKQSIRNVYLANSRHERSHTLPIDGNLPLESFLTRLARDKFNGTITFKLNPKSLGVGKIDKIMGNIENCKKFVEKYFRIE